MEEVYHRIRRLDIQAPENTRDEMTFYVTDEDVHDALRYREEYSEYIPDDD